MTWDGGSIREEMPPNHSPVPSTDPAPSALPIGDLAPEGLLGDGHDLGEDVTRQLVDGPACVCETLACTPLAAET